jgi:hypothetical protein
MILEAFSKTLKQQFRRRGEALHILQEWLSLYLSMPLHSGSSMVQQVLHTEIEQASFSPLTLFRGKSETGDVLLQSLYDYCRSYEDWEYRRWLHTLKASDFEEVSP